MMATLVDSSVWIDFTRARSPRALKRFIAEHVLARDVALAEPVIFELFRYASDEDAAQLEQQFQHVPVISTPSDLWNSGVALGRKCRRIGVNPSSIDLLIAVVAIYHGAEILTFDSGFKDIARASDLKVKLLKRPAS
jgi:predicted nucleic acid-binding protein